MLSKSFKKLIGILGFKLIEKNIVKNDRLLSKNSHLKLELILENLFKLNLFTSLIQIGANDGVRFDCLNKLIKIFKPRTIFVEPIKSNFIDLKKNYSDQENLFFENCAISVNNKINHLFKVKESRLKHYDDHIIGISSFDKNHLLKHGVKRKDIIQEKIQSISIIDLLKKYSITTLDLLFIDTEGYDGEIIIDFIKKSDLKPIIIFEYIHINHEIFKKTLDILNSNSFKYFKVDENIVCFPNNKLEYLKKIF